MIMAEIEHVQEPKLPALADARLAYIEREYFTDLVVKGTDTKTDEEYGEEFDELIESIRAKAWLEGHSFRARVNPYKEKP